MQVRTEARTGPVVGSLPEVVAAVSTRLQKEQHAWRKRLLHDPSRFGELEVAVHHTLQDCADQILAGLLADVGRQPVLEDACKKSS